MHAFLLLALILLISLIAQCGVHTDQSSKEAVVSPQQANAPEQKPETDECDFSIYKPVREDHFVRRAVVKTVKPTYPPEAVQGGAQGWVNVRILVNRDGDVEKACALDGDEKLKKVSEEAALQWKFKHNFGLSNPGRTLYRVDVIAFHFVLDRAERTVSENTVTVRP